MKKKKISGYFLGALISTAIFLIGGSSPQIEPVSAQAIHPCLNRINIPINELYWLYVPESANELYSNERLFFLAGQLINNDVVDASACPTGGLAPDGYANACGMAAAYPKVVEVQNLVNEPVLRAWQEIGVPPVMLKMMIRQESQFWPSVYISTISTPTVHYGYGHMTYIGIENALFWNRNLYAKLCSKVDNPNCISDAGVVNQFLSSLVATCPTCENGINTAIANQTVDILAEVVLGYCYQTSQLIYNATGWYPGLVVDYATIWKLTLMNYSKGPQCVLDTISKTFDMTEGPMTWDEISANVPEGPCEFGITYAKIITSRYYDFPPDK